MNTELEVLNLKCGGCANTIKKGLLAIEGVKEIDILIEDSKVRVSVEREGVLMEIKNSLSKMGYPEVGDSNTVIHKAKSFVSCAVGRVSSSSD